MRKTHGTFIVSSMVKMERTATNERSITLTITVLRGTVSMLEIALCLRAIAAGRQLREEHTAEGALDVYRYRIGPLQNPKAFFAKEDRMLIQSICDFVAIIVVTKGISK